MSKKKASAKKPVPKTASTKKSGTKSRQIKATVSRGRGKVTISFAQPHEALPHLLNLASDIAGKHFDQAAFTPAADDVLGTAAAREIVSGCADSDCWNCTLGDLKLDSNVFQTCVFDGVQERGYTIGRDEIPASQSTQLYTVVMAIQAAKKRVEGS
jgi:hypothetical protein